MARMSGSLSDVPSARLVVASREHVVGGIRATQTQFVAERRMHLADAAQSGDHLRGRCLIKPAAARGLRDQQILRDLTHPLGELIADSEDARDDVGGQRVGERAHQLGRTGGQAIAQFLGAIGDQRLERRNPARGEGLLRELAAYVMSRGVGGQQKPGLIGESPHQRMAHRFGMTAPEPVGDPVLCGDELRREGLRVADSLDDVRVAEHEPEPERLGVDHRRVLPGRRVGGVGVE
jgi:hypothetical protein